MLEITLKPFVVIADYKASVGIVRQGNDLHLTYRVSGDHHGIRWPQAKGEAQPQRQDRLYERTCFEMFLKGSGDRYVEFNFSPSGNWCDYMFESYRIRSLANPSSEPSPIKTPIVFTKKTGDLATLEVGVRLDKYQAFLGLNTAAPIHAGFSIILERLNGEKTYWALSHHGDKPDFHLNESFSAKLL